MARNSPNNPVIPLKLIGGWLRIVGNATSTLQLSKSLPYLKPQSWEEKQGYGPEAVRLVSGHISGTDCAADRQSVWVTLNRVCHELNEHSSHAGQIRRHLERYGKPLCYIPHWHCIIGLAEGVTGMLQVAGVFRIFLEIRRDLDGSQ